MPNSKKSQRPDAVQASPKSSLTARGLRLLWQNPRMAHTLLREEFRKKFGIAFDRRFRAGVSGPPVTLNLNLTRRCNLKCVMCEQHRHTSGPSGLSWYDPRRELPLSDWVNLLDQVASFKPQLYLTGGEPTLYPHFPEFLTAAKQRGFMVHLQANGTLLDRIADHLVTQGVEAVTVSMDGPQEIHDAIRGQKDAFRKTTAGLRALVAARERARPPARSSPLTVSFPKPTWPPWIKWSLWPRIWARISSRFSIPSSMPPPTFSAITATSPLSSPPSRA